MVKLECVHADTCLPDYWGGHHKAHVSFPIYGALSLRDIKREILNELKYGAVAGSDQNAVYLSCDWTSEPEKAQKVFRSAVAAVNRIKPAKKGQRVFFKDIDVDDECPCYAYFVFCEV